MGILTINRRFAAATLFVACTLLTQSACKRTVVTVRDTAAADSLMAELDACKQIRKDLEDKNKSLLKLTSQLQKHEEAARYLQAELDQTRDVLEYAERQFIGIGTVLEDGRIAPRRLMR